MGNEIMFLITGVIFTVATAIMVFTIGSDIK